MSQNHAFKDQLPVERFGTYQVRSGQFDDYYVRFESIPAGFDDRPLLKGLPDDACQCAHWGYVFKGRMKFRYTDGTEAIIAAGEAYYARPGHTFETLEDTETVEFSPRKELDQTFAMVARNLAAADH